MTNTVFGPYSPTAWSDGVTQGNHTTLNNLEQQAGVSLNGFNGDLLTAFVLSGMVATKDGSVVNQLDVTAGRAYATHSDGSRGLIITAASTTGQFTTATPSATYYLDLNPDGTWSFATAHSAQANYLTICSVTTDASGNILAVTDARTLNTTLLGGGSPVKITVLGKLVGHGDGGLTPQVETDTSGVGFGLKYDGTNHWITFVPDPAAGVATGFDWLFVDSGGTYHEGMHLDTGGNLVVSANISGPAGGGIPTTRNGTATSVPVYTGTTTPSSPPTGSVWCKA